LTAVSPSPSPSAPDAQSGLSGDELSNWFENLSQGAMEVGAIIVVCIVLYVLGRLLIRGVIRSIHKGLPFSRSARRALEQAKIVRPELAGQDQSLELERRRQRAQTIGAVLNSALAVFIVVIIVATVLAWVGIPLGPLIASAGIAGVALGFGAQSLVKDVLSGMFMLLEDQYGVGDVIDVGEATGTVEEFGLRSTRLRSADGTVWYVPNGEIRRVGNMTRLWSRALIEVRLAYDTDVSEAREAFLEAATAARAGNPEIDKAILSEPEIPGVESLDYDAVVMRMLVQCTPGTQWAVMRAIRIELRRVLKERGISIALPAGSMYMNAQRPQPREREEPDGAHPREDDDEL
jgi:small-conductance mechanosensitive channel